MNKWLRAFLIGFFAASAAYLYLEQTKKSEPVSHYDMEFLIRVDTDRNMQQDFSLEKTIEVLSLRLSSSLWQFEIIRESEKNQIRIRLYNITDTISPVHVLTSNGRIQFRELYTLEQTTLMLRRVEDVIKESYPGFNLKLTGDNPNDTIKRNLADELSNARTTNNDAPGFVDFSNSQPYRDEQGQMVYYGEIGRVKKSDSAFVREVLETESVKAYWPQGLRICYGEPDTRDAEKLPLYFLNTSFYEDSAWLENRDVRNAEVEFDKQGRPEVDFQFNRAGAIKWAVMTKKNIGRPIAIVMDGTVLSAPVVLAEIPNGVAVITGAYTYAEAQFISLALNSNSLPVNFTIISSETSNKGEASARNSKLLIPLVCFIVFSTLGFFIFKILASRQ